VAAVGYGGDMKRSWRDYDEWADRLAAGEAASGDDYRVAQFVTVLRSTRPGGAPECAPRPKKLAAEALLAARGASNPRGGRSRAPLSMRWRQRAMVSTFLSTLFGKLMLGAVGIALAAGGLGATGNLPDQMQQRTADAMARIGITIPAAAETPTLEQAAGTAKAAVAADHPSALPDQVSETAKAAVAADRTAAKDEQTEGRQAPQLPDQASDKATAIIGTVFGGDPTDGRDFGAAVSATASGGVSQAMPKPSDTGAQKAAENSVAAGGEAGAAANEHRP
jgi:hypothetical protein